MAGLHGRAGLRVAQLIKSLAPQSARWIYRLTPLPRSVKERFAVRAYGLVAPMLPQQTAAGQVWRVEQERARQREQAAAQELAAARAGRPLHLDHAVEVPFESTRAPRPRTLAVLVHMFHEHLAPEFRRYLRNIPCDYDLFVSTDNDTKRDIIAEHFSRYPVRPEIRVVENCGRDIAPKLVAFRDVYDTHELVLHLHSKSSIHEIVLDAWRGHLLENLMGSAEIVRSVLQAFDRIPDLGMIAAQHFEPLRHAVDWGGNFERAEQLARDMGFEVSRHRALDFPSGSMFWVRSAALRPLLDLSLCATDFEPESGQFDATTAHAIERLYYHVCERAGFRWLKIAHPPLFESTPSIHRVRRDADLHRFLDAHAVALTGPDLVPRRQARPEPVRRPAKELVSRLQRRALGEEVDLRCTACVTVGAVPRGQLPSQSRRFLASARRALAHPGLTGNSGVAVLAARGADVDGASERPGPSRPTGYEVGFGAGHDILMQEAFDDGADVYVVSDPAGRFHPDAIAAMIRMAIASEWRAIVAAVQFPAGPARRYHPMSFATPWVSASCLAIPRLVYESVGGFDGSLVTHHEAVDYSWRARARGFCIRVCPRALYSLEVSDRPSDRVSAIESRSSGYRLGKKWRNERFAARMERELASLGAEVPAPDPEPVPSQWSWIADFGPGPDFAGPRW